MKSFSKYTPLPDPITEDEVKLDLVWTADERTRAVIDRQAKLMGFDDPTDFLVDLISQNLADYEAQTVQSEDAGLWIVAWSSIAEGSKHFNDWLGRLRTWFCRGRWLFQVIWGFPCRNCSTWSSSEFSEFLMFYEFRWECERISPCPNGVTHSAAICVPRATNRKCVIIPRTHMPSRCKRKVRRRVFRSRRPNGREVIVAPIIGKDGKVHRFIVLDYRDAIPVHDCDRDVYLRAD